MVCHANKSQNNFHRGWKDGNHRRVISYIYFVPEKMSPDREETRIYAGIFAFEQCVGCKNQMLSFTMININHKFVLEVNYIKKIKRMVFARFSQIKHKF